MKKLFFFCIAVIVSFAANSQDIIIKKSGDEIKVKVLEVGVTEIKYKRFDFQEGPIYTVLKSDVILVRYENGINEVISSTPAISDPSTTNTTTTTPPVAVEKVDNKIENSMGSYRQNGRYISKTRVISILKNTNDPEIQKLLRKSSNKKTTGTVVAMSLGLPLIIFGALTTIRGAVMVNSSSNAFSGNSVDPDARGIATVGGVMLGSGLMLQFLNIGFQVRSNRLVENAVVVYNNKYADLPAATK